MPTYLLTWNPGRWAWEERHQLRAEIEEKGYTCTDWSCGKSKRICKGDRLFMIRLGREPRGIFASGYALSNVYEEPHWDENAPEKLARYISLELEVLLESKDIFSRSALNEGILKEMHWDSQSSGIRIREDIAAELERQWANFLAEKDIYERGPNKKFHKPELYAESQRIEKEGYFNVETLEDARKRVKTSIVQRQGQSRFRQRLLQVYCGRCAITGCDAEPALEAAHIIPYKGPDTNHSANGLLLRADLHTLFDLFLLSIDPETYEVVIAPDLIATCYGDFNRKKLSQPIYTAALPDQGALAKHYEHFREKHNS